MEWILSEIPKVPKNQRTAGFDRETKEVFLNAKIYGNPAALFLCMSFDGVDAVSRDSDLYIPASWLRAEFPALAGDIDLIVLKVRAFFEDSEG
jgi:hypothetical protein